MKSKEDYWERLFTGYERSAGPVEQTPEVPNLS